MSSFRLIGGSGIHFWVYDLGVDEDMMKKAPQPSCNSRCLNITGKERDKISVAP